MGKIRFLHISDLHYDKDKRNIKEICSAFFNDINMVKKEYPIDFILFSGDLVLAGNENNFTEVYENFIKKLIENLEIEQTKFLFCPGNHDVNRNEINDMIEEIIRNKLQDTAERKKLIDNLNEKNYSIYTDRIKDFYNFKKQFIKEEDERFFNIFSSSHIIEKFGIKIGISCINSSIVSNGDDYGKLIICEKQISNSYERIKNCDLKILVMHHPLSYIDEVERTDIERMIIEKFDMFCYGHTHEEEGKKTFYFGEEKSIVTSIAGSLYSGETTHWKGKDYFHGYSIVELDKEECTIYLRKYMSKRNCFDKNIEICPEGKIIYNFSKNKKKYTNINLSVLEETKKLINKKLLTSIPDCEAPKNIEDIFVRPLLTLTSERDFENKNIYSQNITPIKDKSLQKITVEEIIELKENFLIYGKKESGKTTLLNYLIINIIKLNNLDQQIPVFIKFKKISSNKKLEKLICNYINELTTKEVSLKEVKEILEEGRFTIFIDDIDSQKSEELKILNKYIENNIKNKFILAIQDKDLEVNVKNKEITEFTFKKISININSFKNQQAKELILKWKNIENIDNKKILLITNNIKKIGIPLTPYILSLLFWINDKDKNEFNPINKAAILEKFFDIILEKLNIENNYYIPIDFKDKLHYLSFIAEKLKEKENKIMDKRDLEKYTIEYLEKYFIKVKNVSDFINYFLLKGVFIEYDLKIGFKYKSFLEFFIAKKMEAEPKYKNKIISEENYIKNVEEIEYYSGLVRNDEYLLKLIMKYLNNIKNQIKLSNIENYNIPYKKTLIKTNHLINEVTKEKSNVLEEEVEITNNSKNIENQNINLEISKEWYYFETIRLLANIFRNSSYIENLELRKDALEEIIKNYAQILVEVVRKFEEFLEREKLDFKEKEIIILIFSLSLTELAKENIYSAKLQLFLKKEMNKEREENKENDIKTFLLYCLYLDSYYDDSIETIKEYISKEKNPLFLDIIQLKLYKYIKYQICNEEKIARIREVLNIISRKFNKFSNIHQSNYFQSKNAQKIDENIKKILKEKEDSF